MNAREYYKQKYNREVIEEAPVRMTIGEILDLQDEFLQAVNKANEDKTSTESVVCSHIMHEPDAAKGNYHCGKCGEPMEA